MTDRMNSVNCTAQSSSRCFAEAASSCSLRPLQDTAELLVVSIFVLCLICLRIMPQFG